MKTLFITLICSLCFTRYVNGEMLLNKAVVHHTATSDVSVEVIRKNHIEVNEWRDIGYHFLIRKDGTIEKGRDLNMKGAHAKGRNNWIGIALTGYDEFTDEQYEALAKLSIELKLNYLEPHHEECPGKGFSWVRLMEEQSKLNVK